MEKRAKYILFSRDLMVPSEYYPQINDILNELIEKSDFTEYGISVTLSPLFKQRGNEFIANFTGGYTGNFFSNIILARTKSIQTVARYINDEYKAFKESRSDNVKHGERADSGDGVYGDSVSPHHTPHTPPNKTPYTYPSEDTPYQRPKAIPSESYGEYSGIEPGEPEEPGAPEEEYSPPWWN